MIGNVVIEQRMDARLTPGSPRQRRGSSAIGYARFGAAALVLCAVMGLGGLAGCARALFPEDQPRSPYERYMRLRGQYRPSTEPTAWGGERPALRERLAPMGER